MGSDRFGIALALLLGGGVVAAPSRAEDGVEHCGGFITSLPADIATDGTWCMTGDLATAGDGVVVSAGRAVVDCKGFALRNTAPGTNIKTGLRATPANRRVTFRNCRVEGFRYGILAGAYGEVGGVAIIEDNVIVRSRNVGIFALRVLDAQVRRNVVLETSLIPASSSFGDPAAIYVEALGDAVVHGNLVSGVGHPFVARPFRGVVIDVPGHASVLDNVISGVETTAENRGIGLYVTAESRAVLRGNQLSGDGAPASRGMACNGGTGVILSGNLVNGFGAPTSNCPGDVGGQYFEP